MLRDPTSSEWRKHWFVLRRPYLYIYNSSAELDEAAVISIATVRVEHTLEIERMLEVSCHKTADPVQQWAPKLILFSLFRSASMPSPSSRRRTGAQLAR